MPNFSITKFIGFVISCIATKTISICKLEQPMREFLYRLRMIMPDYERLYTHRASGKHSVTRFCMSEEDEENRLRVLKKVG